MARRLDLIDQFTELVVGADDPRRLAERTLEVVMSLLNGRSSAVFTSNGADVTLFASRGIDQAVLEIVPLAWAVQKDALRRGELVYVPDRIAERRIPTLPADRPGPASFVIVPVLEETTLVALLYVDSQDPHFCDAHDLERLSKFSRIVAKSVQDSTSPRPLGGTAVEDMEREKLLLLLNRNEWNIARVARMMGVTRRTVYLRLQRYNIPRERVPKARLKTAAS
jgi:hypothetical protein